MPLCFAHYCHLSTRFATTCYNAGRVRARGAGTGVGNVAGTRWLRRALPPILPQFWFCPSPPLSSSIFMVCWVASCRVAALPAIPCYTPEHRHTWLHCKHQFSLCRRTHDNHCTIPHRSLAHPFPTYVQPVLPISGLPTAAFTMPTFAVCRAFPACRAYAPRLRLWCLRPLICRQFSGRR